jgi:hypothetical protein
MTPGTIRAICALVSLLLGCEILQTGPRIHAAEVVVDSSRYSADCGIEVRHADQRLMLKWPTDEEESGQLVLDLRPERPLIERLSISRGGEDGTLLESMEPMTFMTVGTRVTPRGHPPTLSKWQVFFDKPADRPHQSYLSHRELKAVRVESTGKRATVALGEITIGPFHGELQFTFYAGSPLVHVEAVVTTGEDDRAILYDAGLTGNFPAGTQIAWMNNVDRQIERVPADAQASDRPLAVRHRTIIAETPSGSVACFSPPHQYHYPRDWTDNFGYVWYGRGHLETDAGFGFGIRQDKAGGRAFVPWFNAPPGVEHRLSTFYLVTRGRAKAALDEVLRYTHHDSFPPLPGHITFSSHWHMAIAVEALNQRAKGITELPIPDFVGMFKEMGIDAVHIAEFHGDGHPRDPGPLRLRELESMFSECQRLSDNELLMIPGEEANVYLGLAEPGKHPGHWLYLFPRPVYWIMQRGADEPFAESDPRFGTLYRVGSRQDMVELLRRENGLAWVAHPRIKASSWTPDIFRHEDFYLADFWLGAAWKAMPAELSREKLGERVLDLLSDMANWGQKKYVPGEVDVFKLDRTHELSGHMNINYLRLDRLPKYEDGWQPILDALRAGAFFVTTGEVLVREFTVGGKQTGQELSLAGNAQPEIRVQLDWTFPLRFAEVISGDGEKVYRERIDLPDTGSFGQRTLTLKPDLRGRKWVRFEVWDVAANGAFTQPVWLIRAGTQKDE